MRRIFAVLLGLVAAFSIGITAYAEEYAAHYLKDSPAFTYTDEESGVVFTVPDGWHEESVGDAKRTDAKFVHDQNSEILILYTCEDLYGGNSVFESLPEISRGDIDNSLLSPQVVSEMVGRPEDEISQITLGSMEYYRAGIEYQQYGVVVHGTVLICYHNGYLYMYRFFGGADHPRFADFEEMMRSVKYPIVEKEQEAVNAWLDSYMVNLLFSLILTVAVYSLPIFIYRWCIRRYPVEKKKAKIIAIVYGIVSWIAMSAILFAIGEKGVAGGAVFLWGCINYYVLINGKDRRKAKNDLGDAAQDEDPWTKSDRPGPGGEED